MTTDVFNFDSIAGQPATLEINECDSHLTVTWGRLIVTDTFGHVGFWISFHKCRGSFAKGAARDAALRKHARETIEAEIYEQLRAAREND